jgi:hypothetical protein
MTWGSAARRGIASTYLPVTLPYRNPRIIAAIAASHAGKPPSQFVAASNAAFRAGAIHDGVPETVGPCMGQRPALSLRIPEETREGMGLDGVGRQPVVSSTRRIHMSEGKVHVEIVYCVS